MNQVRRTEMFIASRKLIRPEPRQGDIYRTETRSIRFNVIRLVTCQTMSALQAWKIKKAFGFYKHPGPTGLAHCRRTASNKTYCFINLSGGRFIRRTKSAKRGSECKGSNIGRLGKCCKTGACSS